MEENLYRLSPVQQEMMEIRQPGEVYYRKIEIHCPLLTCCTIIRASASGTHTLGHILQQKLPVFHCMLQLLWEMSCLHSAGHKDLWTTAPIILRITLAFKAKLKLKSVRSLGGAQSRHSAWELLMTWESPQTGPC